MLFLAGMGLDFYTFLATWKKSKKSNICISDEAVHTQKARPRDEQTDRNHYTTGRSNKPSRQ